MTVRPFQSGDEDAVVRLWEMCGLIVPQNDPRHDIQLKLQMQPELFLVGVQQHDARIVAAVMAGYDGHRGWINYLAVSPDHQRHGFGRQMVEAAISRLAALGCPKVNLQIRTSNTQVIAFYERLGFRTDAVVSMGRRL